MKEFVEKLIERLEEEKFDCIVAKNYMPEVVELNVVKKISNDLASEHNNDFCEWKEDGVFYNIDCKGKEYICTAISEFEFCPYCGKKIKVMPAPYKKGE